MDRVDCFYALHLNYHEVFDDQIDSISEIEFLSVVNNRQPNLRVYPETPLS